jgi:hypothetical protein
MVPTSIRDYPEWHLGRQNYALWYLEINDQKIVDYLDALRAHFSEFLLEPNSRQYHITLFICGFLTHETRIYSDDFSVYASFACKRFDNEVDLGLLKVGHNECAGVLAQARSEFYKKNQVLTPELDSMIWEKFCERLPSFEQNILGFHIAEIIRGIS